MVLANLGITLLIFALTINNSRAEEEKSHCGIKPIAGINLAGAGFSSKKIPGRVGYDYKFPDLAHLLYYKEKGFKSIRLSILWERLQPSLYSELEVSYLNQIKIFLQQAQQLNLKVLLDLHNYGRYQNQIIGSDYVPVSAFYDIWNKLASELNSFSSLYAYGLMNEPYDTNGYWHKVAQYGVDGIRSIDKLKVIYVPGEFWSSSWMWPKANPQPFVTDPQNNLVYEAHIYFDKNASGAYVDQNEILKKGEVTQRLMPFIKWLDKYGLKGAIGEWGVPSDNAAWFSVVEEFISVTNAHCLDWYIWAGGPWPKNYPLSLEPKQGEDTLLMMHLNNFLSNSP